MVLAGAEKGEKKIARGSISNAQRICGRVQDRSRAVNVSSRS